MSIKLKIYGDVNTTNKHQLLIGLDLPNQHPIESIKNLRQELDKRYIKPIGGIPASDLADSYITADMLQELDNRMQAMYASCSNLIEENKIKIDNNILGIQNINKYIFDINNRIDTLESKISDKVDNVSSPVNIIQKTFECTDDNKTFTATIIDTDLKVLEPTIIKGEKLCSVNDDYTIEYPDDTTLSITFINNGEYKINYISGELSESQYDVLYKYLKEIEKKYINYNKGSIISPEHNVSIEYDENDRIIKEVYSGNINKTISYEYDSSDNIVKKIVVQDDTIKTANYLYNDNGKLILVEDNGTDIPVDGTKAPKFTLEIEYDEQGFISKEIYSGEINKTISYINNQFGDVISKTVYEDGIIKKAEYIYDENRKLISVKDNGTEKIAVVFNNVSIPDSSSETVSGDDITKEDVDLIFSTIYKEVI